MSEASKETLRGTVAELVADYKEYDELCKKEDEIERSALDEYEDAEAVVDRLRERPLCAEVRSSWVSLGSQLTSDEFKILLGTGGPAYWISGDLDEHHEPTNVKAFHQDWFEPAQVIHLNEDEQAAVDWFAQLFYWGA